MSSRIFLFGEAEKGDICTPYRLKTPIELYETFGHPPEDSQGINYAIHTLMSGRELIFFRVKEEGFSGEDYVKGIRLLENQGSKLKLAAVCIPGVGDKEIIESLTPFCKRHKSILILSEKDLYDYLTESKY